MSKRKVGKHIYIGSKEEQQQCEEEEIDGTLPIKITYMMFRTISTNDIVTNSFFSARGKPAHGQQVSLDQYVGNIVLNLLKTAADEDVAKLRKGALAVPACTCTFRACASAFDHVIVISVAARACAASAVKAAHRLLSSDSLFDAGKGGSESHAMRVRIHVHLTRPRARTRVCAALEETQFMINSTEFRRNIALIRSSDKVIFQDCRRAKYMLASMELQATLATWEQKNRKKHWKWFMAAFRGFFGSVGAIPLAGPVLGLVVSYGADLMEAGINYKMALADRAVRACTCCVRMRILRGAPQPTNCNLASVLANSCLRKTSFCRCFRASSLLFRIAWYQADLHGHAFQRCHVHGFPIISRASTRADGLSGARARARQRPALLTVLPRARGRARAQQIEEALAGVARLNTEIMERLQSMVAAQSKAPAANAKFHSLRRQQPQSHNPRSVRCLKPVVS